MNLLNPWALAAGLLAGLIVLMYLLKLRRRRQEVSSTLLWTRSLEDLIANAPFQRLRRNLLMYLQILTVLLLALALARPTLWLNRRPAGARILLIDNTASMNANDMPGGISRLEEAKRQAREVIGNLSRGEEAMIMTLGGRARIVQPFTGEPGLLRGAVDSIEPTDAQAATREALAIVQGVFKVHPEALLVILGDGGLGYLGTMIGKDEPVEYRCIGSGSDNRGIVAFDVRPSFERRDRLSAFAEVENFSDRPSSIIVRCLLDGELVQAREARLEPKARQGFAFTDLEPGPAERLLQLEIGPEDALAADNNARAIVRRAGSIRVLLVSRGDFFLERVLALLPAVEASRMAPEQFTPTTQADIVIFDGHQPNGIGPGRYLFLDAVPPIEGWSAAEQPLKNQAVLDWNRLHPITRFVSFEQLGLAQCKNLRMPDWTTVLAESAASPLIVAGESRGIRLVCIGFDPYASDWPLQTSFPIFFANAVDWLAGAARGELAEPLHRTGETISFRPDGQAAVIDPGGRRWEIVPGAEGLAYFDQTLRAGLYTAQLGKDLKPRFAVNLLAPGESAIAPAPSLIAGERQIASVAGRRENRQVWHWLALAGLALLTIEWHLYSRRSWL